MHISLLGKLRTTSFWQSPVRPYAVPVVAVGVVAAAIQAPSLAQGLLVATGLMAPPQVSVIQPPAMGTPLTPTAAAVPPQTMAAPPTAATFADPDARIFYVDYDDGNDANDGRSPATAWKHAPGDASATGKAKALYRKYEPGDVIRFKGGVRYRGIIQPRGTGSAERPVIYDGSSWGPTRAIIDGGNELSGLRRCASAADCLDSPYWRQLWRANIPADAKWYDWLFVNDKPLMPSQYPAVSAPTDFDDINLFLTVPKAELSLLKAGVINQPIPAGFDKGQPVLSIWAYGNLVSYAHDINVSTSGVNFTNATWDIRENNPYPDRDNKFALLNLPKMVNRPGLFAMSPQDGVVIFWPHANMGAQADGMGGLMSATVKSVSIGGARTGIKPVNFKNLIIRGFSFANFSRASLVSLTTGSDNIEVSDNIFHGNASAYSRAGTIGLKFTTNVRILRNEIHEAIGSPGMILDYSEGPVVVKCNLISETGRTGIRLLNIRKGIVQGNYLKGIKGAHSNALTAYLDIRESSITDNVVIDSVRPLTVKGTPTPYFSEGEHGTYVARNVLINSDANSPTVTSYGATKNFVLEDNFISGPGKAISLLGTDTGMVIRNNQIIGSIIQPRGMSLVDNSNPVFDPNGNGGLLLASKQNAQVSPSICS